MRGVGFEAMTSASGDHSIPNPQSPTTHMPRRDFLTLAGRGALWAALGASVVALIRFLGFAEPETPKVYTLGTPEAFPLGALTPVAEGRAFVGRDARGLYALAATCTHLGCLVRPQDGGFACPCHGSRFDANGAVSQGPAARPLARAGLTIGTDGKIVLNLGETVDADHRLRLDERESS